MVLCTGVLGSVDPWSLEATRSTYSHCVPRSSQPAGKEFNTAKDRSPYDDRWMLV